LAKPVVDGIERDVEDKAQVLRLSVTDKVGRQLAMRYGVRGVPTRVLLDGNGNVVLTQAGPPQREEIRTAVERLTG
jgi:thioredoxin-related protein